MRKPILDWANMKLTKEQQQLVADNEKLIGFVACKLFDFPMSSDMYNYCYGYAAYGLCQAAILYDPSKGSFAGFACIRIRFEVGHALKKFSRYNEALKPLSLDAKINSDADDDTFNSLIPAPDEFEPLEYRILAESVYQKVEPVLTPRQKEIFRIWLHGKNQDEIAEQLKVAEQNVSCTLIRAKKKCRACFDPTDIFS